MRCFFRLGITLRVLNRLLQLFDLRRELLVLLLRDLREAQCRFATNGLGAELEAAHDVERRPHFVLGNVGLHPLTCFGVLVLAVVVELNVLGKKWLLRVENQLEGGADLKELVVAGLG